MLFFRHLLLLSFLLLVSFIGKGADTLVSYKLLQRIAQLQPKKDAVFPKGLFPSYRIYALNKDRQKADVNIFFTGLIAFTLRDILPTLTPHQQKIAQSIIDQSLPVAAKFKNQKGRDTYNFWPTDDPQIFPNAGWLNWFDKSQALPDDLDDTAIMLLALAANKTRAKEVHAFMQDFTNTPKKQITNTFSEYKNIQAYSTWFGIKMPVDFDVCVLTNVLLMVQKYDLSWTNADSASLALIVKVIDSKKHLTAAPYISPHYSRSPIILYHLARLMHIKPILELEKRKQQLITDAQVLFNQSDSFLDQVMLSTALLKWGVQPPVVQPKMVNSMQALVEDESFSFFIANMASMLPDPLKQWVGNIGLGKFYYYCPAYSNLLVLEYLATTQRMTVPLH